MLNSKRTASNAGCKLLCAQEEAVPPQPALTRLATQPKLSTVVLPLGFGGRMLPFAFFFFWLWQLNVVQFLSEKPAVQPLVGLTMFLSHLNDKWDFTEEIAPVLLA